MIAAALALALLGLLHRFLVPIIQGSSRTSVKVHLRQHATVTLTKLAQDLRQSTAHGVVFWAGDDGSLALGLTRVESVNAGGGSLYEKNLTAYYWNRELGTVLRKRWPPAPPDLGITPNIANPFSVTPEQLEQIASETNGSERLLANNVVGFDPLQGYPVSPFACSIRLEKAVPGRDEPAVLELKRTVAFRN